MNVIDLASLPPATAPVDCGGARHRVRWVADIARYAPSSDTAAMVKRLSQRVPRVAHGPESSVDAHDGEPLWGS